MSERNEVIARRFLNDVVNNGCTQLLSELVAPDFIGHEPHGDHYGPEGARIVVADYRVAFPDLCVTVEDLVAHEDKVAFRFLLRGTHTGPFMGIHPTGQPVVVGGMAMQRLVDGRLVESWMYLDAMNLPHQPGAAPTLELGSGPQPAQPPGGTDRQELTIGLELGSES